MFELNLCFEVSNLAYLGGKCFFYMLYSRAGFDLESTVA